MSMEEQDMLKSAVKEFAQKAIVDKVLKIEHEGIDDSLLKALASQGFLAARLPEKYGGSGIDHEGYLAILEELATFSPSVAAIVMLTNSLAGPLVGDKAPDIMGKVASGEARIAISLAPVLNGSIDYEGLEKSGNSVKGELKHTAVSNGDFAIALSESDDNLLLVKGGLSAGSRDQGLSFRGLNYGTLKADSSDYEVLSSEGKKALSSAIDNSDLEVAAIALGISRGALDKAVEYVKVRKTFDRPLKDYGPVSATLSKLMAELEILGCYMRNLDHGNRKDRLMIKILSVDLAKRATKYSLQFHGGYGYIEDFGVEKFYRDAMGLSILFQRPHEDSERLP